MENEINNKNNPLLNLNIGELPYLECEKCNNTVFEEKLMIKKVSKILTGSPQDGIIPIPILVCASCGNINEQFKLIK